MFAALSVNMQTNLSFAPRPHNHGSTSTAITNCLCCLAGKQSPSAGLLREGVVVQSGTTSMVEAGFHNVVRVKSNLPISDRITIRLTRISPELEGEIAEPSGLTIYWGFRVARGNVSLSEIVRNRKFDLIISTSRKGTDVREITPELREKWVSSKRPLIVFGSPSDGVPEILSN